MKEKNNKQKRKDGENKEKINPKRFFLKIKKSKALSALFIIVVAAAVALCSVGIVNFAKTAYLRPYMHKYPSVSFPEGIEERFCDYYGQHPETVGYIEIPDASYSEYILSENNHLNPVLDKSNVRKGLDFNTVVYLTSPQADIESCYAASGNYLKSTQKVTYSTLYESYDFNIIGTFYTNSNPEDDLNYCFPYNVTKEMTAKSLEAYTDRLYHRFLYNTDYEISSDDKLITICAKTDFMPDMLFVAVGVLDGDTQTTANENNAVHYPQVWYDQNNKTNIYRFASKWYPQIKTTDENGAESVSQQSSEEFTKF